jgi:sporulation protein YhbH
VSIFREHKSIADRSAADRQRHKRLIDRAIKDSIKDVIAEESIIGQSGNKKIKIPVKGIKEYQFVYGSNQNNKRVGSGGEHDIKPGDQIGKKQEPSQGDQAGNQEGEERYEVEVTLEELAEYLFSDLNLPNLEKKKFKFVKEKTLKRKGFRKAGIRPRLSKKETLKRRIRRKNAAIKAGTYNPEDGERFPFHKDDLKYKDLKPRLKESSSAVAFFLMDVSGSMGKDKKYLARALFFLLYQFLNHRYDNVEVVFISHTTTSKEVTENEFFTRGESGGTMMSSALELELDIIQKRFHPSSWNIYTFYCGDGENWPDDDPAVLEMLPQIKSMSQLVCYTEIISESSSQRRQFLFGSDAFSEELWDKLQPLTNNIFKRARISSKEEIWPLFRRLFGRDLK